MTWFELVELTDRHAVYDYYPDKDMSDRGRLSFNRDNGTWSVEERARADRFSSYSNHLGHRLEELNKSGELQQSGYVAWC